MACACGGNEELCQITRIEEKIQAQDEIIRQNQTDMAQVKSDTAWLVKLGVATFIVAATLAGSSLVTAIQGAGD